jgi:hypothetical protein
MPQRYAPNSRAVRGPCSADNFSVPDETSGILPGMERVSARLRARIEHDFPAPGTADEIARRVGEASDSERVQAAIVLWAAGSVERLLDSVNLARADWRDVLVRGGLEHENWADRLDAELGPSRYGQGYGGTLANAMTQTDDEAYELRAG